METRSLNLVLASPDEVRAMIDAMPPEVRAELSADWLARFHAAPAADPWVHGFRIVHRETGAAVGHVCFKAPPADGAVEIAYGIDAEHQRKGYATEAAAALTAYAFAAGVETVRAHTRPEPNASTRVLTRCGFRRVGEVIDPDDGLVWRWERHRAAAGG